MQKIWEKREDESAKAFNAFCKYRDMPPFERSLEKTCQKLGKKWTSYHSHLKKWSSEKNWVKRSEAWDAFRDQQTEQKRIDTWNESKAKLEKLADGFIAKTAQRLIDIQNQDIPAMTLSRWMVDALKVMRDIRGEPSEIIEQRVRIDLEGAWKKLIEENGDNNTI